MSLVVSNSAEIEMLKKILGQNLIGDTFHFRLYDTDVTPAEGDTYLSYNESGGTGYSAHTGYGDSWVIGDSGGISKADFPEVTFTYTGGDTLYGYYITSKDSTGDTVLLWAEEFSDGPYTIPSGGGTCKVTPKITLA